MGRLINKKVQREHVNPSIYKEHQQLGKWTTILFGIVLACLTPLIFLEALVVSREPTGLYIYIVLDLTFLLLFLNFRRLTIEITEDIISVSFGFIKKSIPVGNVVSCEACHVGYGMYGGPGIRFGGDGSFAFIASMGDAVRLDRVKGRSFIFSTSRQDDVVSLLNELIEGT